MSDIVCIFAHPDDEAFGPGGTIAKLAQDNNVYLICCTVSHPIRKNELLSSANILGIKQVFFLNFRDGDLSNNQYHQLADEIKKILDRIKPVTLLTFHPNGVSGHIDHITVTSVIDFLFPKIKYAKEILYYCMRDCERSLIPGYFIYMPPGIPKPHTHKIVNVSEVWTTKRSAMKQHKSQLKDLLLVLTRQKVLPKEEWFLVRSRGD